MTLIALPLHFRPVQFQRVPAILQVLHVQSNQFLDRIPIHGNLDRQEGLAVLYQNF